MYVKHLLITLIALAFTLTASADGGEKSEIIFGYCDDEIVLGPVPPPGILTYAICLPGELTHRYIGCKITKIDVGLCGEATHLMPVISKVSEFFNFAEQAETVGKKGWNELVLDNPYTITSVETIYVGYMCECANVGSSSTSSQYGNNIYVAEMGQWLSEGGSGVGSLSIRLHIEGEDLPLEVVISGNQFIECVKGETVELVPGIFNYTPLQIESLTIGCYLNGTRFDTKTLNTPIGQGSIEKLPFTITSPSTSGFHTVSLVVEGINGQPFRSDPSYVDFFVSSKMYPRRIVMEEGTGTWCEWCPRGIVTTKEMLKKYPDNFIPIAFHDDTEMGKVYNYEQIRNLLDTGFPVCIINRDQSRISALDIDITEKQIVELKDRAQADIHAEMSVLDADTTRLLVKTRTEFGFSAPYPYNIAYVVVENNVGPYLQKNGYSGSSIPMGGFENEKSYVYTLYDHVARSISDSFEGVSGLFPEKIVEGEVYENEYELIVPDNVECRSNIEVVTLLLNSDSGQIINAWKCGFGKSDTDAISDTLTPSRTSEVYSLSGIKLTAPQRGLNIIREGDSFKKVTKH